MGYNNFAYMLGKRPRRSIYECNFDRPMLVDGGGTPAVGNDLDMIVTSITNAATLAQLANGNRITANAGGAGANVSAFAAGRLGAGVLPCDFAYRPAMMIELTIPAILTGKSVLAGIRLTGGVTIGADNDQALFYYRQGTDTYWMLQTSNNNTDTTAASAVAVAFDTRYKLIVGVGSDLYARFWIGVGDARPVLVWTSTAVVRVGQALAPFITFLAATAISFDLHRVVVTRELS